MWRKPLWIAAEIPSTLKRYKHRTEERRDGKNRMEEKSHQLQQEVCEERAWKRCTWSQTCFQTSGHLWLDLVKVGLGCDGHRHRTHTHRAHQIRSTKAQYAQAQLSCFTVLDELCVCGCLYVNENLNEICSSLCLFRRLGYNCFIHVLHFLCLDNFVCMDLMSGWEMIRKY